MALHGVTDRLGPLVDEHSQARPLVVWRAADKEVTGWWPPGLLEPIDVGLEAASRKDDDAREDFLSFSRDLVSSMIISFILLMSLAIKMTSSGY